MKVLRVLPELHYGGVETRCRVLAEHNFKDLHVIFCSLGKMGATYQQLIRTGNDVRTLSQDVSIRNLACTSALARCIRDVRPDLVHSSIMEANFHALLAGFLKPSIPVIVEEVGVSAGVAKRSLKLRLALAAVYRRSNLIISISQAVSNYLVTKEWVDPSMIRIVPNCFEPRYATFYPTEHLARSNGPSLELLAIGRLVDVKNHAFLIDVVHSLRTAGVECNLSIVGEGPEKPRLASMIQDRRLGSFIKLLGYRQDVPDLVRKHDLLVHPSLIEGYGLVLVEALASGLPVIASRVGGIPEVMGPLATRWTLPLDMNHWVEVITRFSRMSLESKKAAFLPGINFVYETFSSNSYLQNLRKAYLSVF